LKRGVALRRQAGGGGGGVGSGVAAQYDKVALAARIAPAAR
jgi:hypothetical protein